LFVFEFKQYRSVLQVLAKKKAIEQLIKAANAKIDQLAFFLSHRHFKINGNCY
jgi:uncharacterized protein YebE (UPF0316 family)